jgi:hypothetical protein
MNRKRTPLSATLAVLTALGLGLLPGGVANAAGLTILQPTGGVRATGPCNGPRQPITDDFGHPGVMLCESTALQINFGGGNIVDVLIGVLGDTRPVYADGGSGWHRVGNGAADHEWDHCRGPDTLGLFRQDDPHVFSVVGTDAYFYWVRAYPDGSFSDWNQTKLACP